MHRYAATEKQVRESALWNRGVQAWTLPYANPHLTSRRPLDMNIPTALVCWFDQLLPFFGFKQTDTIWHADQSHQCLSEEGSTPEIFMEDLLFLGPKIEGPRQCVRTGGRSLRAGIFHECAYCLVDPKMSSVIFKPIDMCTTLDDGCEKGAKNLISR